MGTNRRSRRRSAARILNSTANSKRSRNTPSPLDECTNDFETSHMEDVPGQRHHIEASMQDVPIPSITSPGDQAETTRTNTLERNDGRPGTQFTMAEICSYELMTLLDEAGCPLNTYGQVVTLLKKQEKRGFSYSKAHSREQLLKLLRQKFHCPTIHSTIIGNCEVFSFPFVDMLQDLVDTAGIRLHRIYPNDDTLPSNDELWSTTWMQETFQCPQHMDFNSKTDIMLPIILYLDKTGTDVLQRYSLEPMLFTVAALDRETRENRRYWRHMGFIPSSKSIEDSKDSLQFYHHCMGAILSSFKQAQQTRPRLRIQNADGSHSFLHAHVPLMIIMGDQLSQDTICCRRKANAGGAGRVHRSCMCSYLNTDDHLSKCQPVPKEVMDNLIAFSTRSVEDFYAIIDNETSIENKVDAKSQNSRSMKYLRRQKQMYSNILSRPFTTHPVITAFHDIDFGAWKSGVYDATFDDFMHSFEEGMMENIGATLFDGLVLKEAENIESLMTTVLSPIRSSARSTFPRWRIQKGFSRQTLMTMGERVGSIFSLALALHTPDIARVFQDGHERQRRKYDLLAESADAESIPMYYEKYIHTLTMDQCKDTLTHLYRHGFDITIIETLDIFQINQLMYHTSVLFDNLTYPESYPEYDHIGEMYSDKGNRLKINQRLINMVYMAMNAKPEDFIRRHRTIPVDNVVPKHHRRKPKQKGDGSTCAFLGTKIGSLMLLLEYTLCYHSFCKYSSSLPSSMKQDWDLIDYSGRMLMMYFSKMIYRGDGTIDSRTTKIHAQRRTGHNFKTLCNVMHSCCEVGERLLKTEAKKISRTAQQRGNTTFERQTCNRILDRHLIDKMRLYLEYGTTNGEDTVAATNAGNTEKTDTFAREAPHFVLLRSNSQVCSCDRKGKRYPPNAITGCLDPFVIQKLLESEPSLEEIDVYNEVVLRDKMYVRAHPNYRREGPWYDFVNVQWEDSSGDSYLLPAQCRAFYKKGEECMAVVQSVDITSEGKVRGNFNSVLTTHYNMQCTRTGDPILYTVNCASIDCTLLVVDHNTGGSISDRQKRSVMVVRPRNEWAHVWYIWNQHLRSKNTNRTSTRPFVDLGGEEMIVKVRSLVTASIKDTGHCSNSPSTT